MKKKCILSQRPLIFSTSSYFIYSGRDVRSGLELPIIDRIFTRDYFISVFKEIIFLPGIL